MSKKICCFFGHRKIEISDELKNKLFTIIEKLIVNKKIDTFLFGSKSQFDDLCYQITSDLKISYPHIKRVYVRAHHPYITDEYRHYLLQYYEETYYPINTMKSGKLSYIERNREMINKSDFCIIYFDKNYLPPRRKQRNNDLTDYQPKSGTRIAFDYATKRNLKIFNVFEQ